MAHVADWRAPWMRDLESAQQEVTRAARLLSGDFRPETDLGDAARAVESTLARIYDAVDQRGDRGRATGDAIAEVKQAVQQLEPSAEVVAVRSALAALHSGRGHLEQAHAALAAQPPERPLEPAAELRASGDLPLLHDVRRASLAPKISVAAPLPADPAKTAEVKRPETFEELAQVTEAMRADADERMRGIFQRAAPPPTEPAPAAEATRDGFRADAPPALSDEAFIRARARECLEEVAMVAMQRRPLPGDPWRTSLVLEQRMLRAIDLIAALGPTALAQLESLTMDAPIKDGPRLFAIAMTLGCVRGRDALGTVERVFLDYEQLDPSARHALADALKLVPHSSLASWLQTLLGDSDERHRALAIDVLSYRGMATDRELASAAVDVPMVASLALPALALLKPAMAGEVTEPALRSDDPVLRRAAWLALMLADHPRARHELRDALGGAQSDDAALLLALCGDQDDASLLSERLREAPTPALVSALGWAGEGSSFAGLVELLSHDDQAIASCAADALERIYAANLIEEAEVLAEEIEVPEPPAPNVGEPKKTKLVHMVSDPRYLPPEPSTETITRPSTDPSQWSAWWHAHGNVFSAGRRYRRGQPYRPAVSHHELDALSCTFDDRRLLQLELMIRTGDRVRFDPHDFVATQEASLRAWGAIAERKGEAPGHWRRPPLANR